MYSFVDKSDRKLCLRPEFTSSVLRAILNSSSSDAVKGVYYYGSAYRYERPQHGRYREFHQFGGEVIHCDNDVHDTEVICLCHSILSQLELLPKTKLLIKSLGDDDAMKQYRDCLYRYFSKYADSLS